MRIGLGQFNAVLGDLEANARRINKLYADALERQVDLLVVPELAICGYPPEDLLLKPHFIQDNRPILEKLAKDCPKMAMIVGFPDYHQQKAYNAAALLRNSKIEKIYRKALLPNYGVFDEKRYFHPGTEPVIVTVNNIKIALTICEDIWDIQWLGDFLGNKDQIDMVLNISASPFHIGRGEKRQQVISNCAKAFACAVGCCNLVGGQDELVFDGRSMIADTDGQVVAMAKGFKEDLLIADLNTTGQGPIEVKPLDPAAPQPKDLVDEAYQALVLGTRDYVRKNGFKQVLIGLSGGIDSALTAAIAADALGSKSVISVTMPSRFNSPETISDAVKLAENLDMLLHTIPIEPILKAFDNSLQVIPGWDNKGIAYENLQARIRGTIMMSLSNQLGAMVLTTGNKSETAVGYATLYGDTAGGFAVIKDVPKTLVYKLAQHINSINDREVIPIDTITRPPSAELKADQKDTDSLPDYDLLDEILKGYVEQDKSAEQLIEMGLPADTVKRIITMVDRNEYKRRQSPPGIKITPKAFGRDRRLPITNRYKSAPQDR